MRACLYDRTGPAREVLRIADVDRPEPGPGQVRVRVHLSGVNPTDVKSRGGITPRRIDGFQIPHHDGAGVIDAVGPGVDEARIGERVWLWMAAGTKWGTGGEWSVVPSEQAVALPEHASDELGACLGVPAMTAHWCLFSDGPLGGASVLVAGGAGAVGHYAIQLARRAGARVATTVSGPEKARLARAAGADLVVNYREPDALDQLKSFSAVMDRIVEVNLPANLELDLNLSGATTTIVTYAATSEDATLPTRRCMTANVTFRFILLYGVGREALLRAAAEISEAAAAGDLTELPLRRFALDDVVAAHEAVEEGVLGKVVLAPS
jgi:NADPH2:quinone reductase